MPPKRKTRSSSSSSPEAPKKRPVTADVTTTAVQPRAQTETETEYDYDHGVVMHDYYPKVLANARCRAYASGELPKPIDELTTTLASTAPERSRITPGRSVIHWFRTDLRIEDNTALHRASGLAASADAHLIGLFVFSPQDLDAHLVSPARVDFVLRTLEVLKKDLAAKDIPLWIETVEKRRNVSTRVVELAEEWGAKHIFANMEYEVDELRRDAKTVRLAAENGVNLEVLHDTCVVPPGELVTKSTGKTFTVYTPWYRAWLSYVTKNPDLLKIHPSPQSNPSSARDNYSDLFDCAIPSAPDSKVLTMIEAKNVHSMFPAGSHEAQSRLERFLAKKVGSYADNRNFPAKPGTSVLSVHFSSGTLSVRTAVVAAKKANKDLLSSGNTGITTWISEVAWRDFYRHVLVGFPYICMNKPFKPEYASITWHVPATDGKEIEDRFKMWCEGRTGYPIVDAAMRHMHAQKYMPNRLRMVVGSFLAKDLHVDWRRGERFFMENLIDCDFASNNGGWGFASSAGVDPQPYFRIFNPVRQSERFDPDGEYIRTWLPELKDVKGKEIHEPSAAVRTRTKYPKKCVEHDVQRKIALEMYKEGIEKGKNAP